MWVFEFLAEITVGRPLNAWHSTGENQQFFGIVPYACLYYEYVLIDNGAIEWRVAGAAVVGTDNQSTYRWEGVDYNVCTYTFILYVCM